MKSWADSSDDEDDYSPQLPKPQQLPPQQTLAKSPFTPINTTTTITTLNTASQTSYPQPQSVVTLPTTSTTPAHKPATFARKSSTPLGPEEPQMDEDDTFSIDDQPNIPPLHDNNTHYTDEDDDHDFDKSYTFSPAAPATPHKVQEAPYQPTQLPQQSPTRPILSVVNKSPHYFFYIGPHTNVQAVESYLLDTTYIKPQAIEPLYPRDFPQNIENLGLSDVDMVYIIYYRDFDDLSLTYRRYSDAMAHDTYFLFSMMFDDETDIEENCQRKYHSYLVKSRKIQKPVELVPEPTSHLLEPENLQNDQPQQLNQALSLSPEETPPPQELLPPPELHPIHTVTTSTPVVVSTPTHPETKQKYHRIDSRKSEKIEKSAKPVITIKESTVPLVTVSAVPVKATAVKPVAHSRSKRDETIESKSKSQPQLQHHSENKKHDRKQLEKKTQLSLQHPLPIPVSLPPPFIPTPAVVPATAVIKAPITALDDDDDGTVRQVYNPKRENRRARGTKNAAAPVIDVPGTVAVVNECQLPTDVVVTTEPKAEKKIKRTKQHEVAHIVTVPIIAIADTDQIKKTSHKEKKKFKKENLPTLLPQQKQPQQVVDVSNKKDFFQRKTEKLGQKDIPKPPITEKKPFADKKGEKKTFDKKTIVDKKADQVDKQVDALSLFIETELKTQKSPAQSPPKKAPASNSGSLNKFSLLGSDDDF